MGVDLTFAPERFPDSTMPWFLAYTRLDLDGRYYDLYSELDNYAEPLGQEIDWYFDDGLRKTATTPYGDVLTFVLPRHVKKALKDLELGMKDFNKWDRGVFAFIRNLPRDTRIVLWYH